MTELVEGSSWTRDPDENLIKSFGPSSYIRYML